MSALYEQLRVVSSSLEDTSEPYVMIQSYIALLRQMLEDNDSVFMNKVVEVWSSPDIQEIVSVVYAGLLGDAHDAIDKGIADLEHLANNPEE